MAVKQILFYFWWSLGIQLDCNGICNFICDCSVGKWGIDELRLSDQYNKVAWGQGCVLQANAKNGSSQDVANIYTSGHFYY